MKGEKQPGDDFQEIDEVICKFPTRELHAFIDKQFQPLNPF